MEKGKTDMERSAEMIELKPCPFCGGKADIYEPDVDIETHLVYCTKCQAETQLFAKREEAIEAWNRRADEQTKPLP